MDQVQTPTPEVEQAATDTNALSLGVSIFHGHVIVNFSKPIEKMSLTLKEARALALALRQNVNRIERLGRDAG